MYNKSDVAYEDKACGKDKCSDCKTFMGNGKCSLVKGAISASGWCNQYAEKREDGSTNLMHEHDKVRSRTTGKLVEISMGMHGSGLVPKNPFASLAQAGYMHAHPEVLGKDALAEWDAATKGKKLPKHKKK